MLYRYTLSWSLSLYGHHWSTTTAANNGDGTSRDVGNISNFGYDTSWAIFLEAKEALPENKRAFPCLLHDIRGTSRPKCPGSYGYDMLVAKSFERWLGSRTVKKHILVAHKSWRISLHLRLEITW